MLSRLYFSAISKYYRSTANKNDSEHTQDYKRLLPVGEGKAEILRFTVKRIEVFSSFYVDF